VVNVGTEANHPVEGIQASFLRCLDQQALQSGLVLSCGEDRASAGHLLSWRPRGGGAIAATPAGAGSRVHRAAAARVHRPTTHGERKARPAPVREGRPG
jgi:hypothetical protein